jgi:protease-4
MSNYAASGGYFISTAADYIIAEPATLTGSIGVVGGKFVFAKLWENIDINWGEINFGENASILSSNHLFTEAEKKIFNASLDQVYQDFTAKVMRARNFDETKINDIARGRVWLGQDALKLGLIDEIGGIDDALIKAKNLAQIMPGDKFSLQYYPRRQSFQEKLTKFIENGGGLPAIKMMDKYGVNLKDIQMLRHLRFDTIMTPFKVSM